MSKVLIKNSTLTDIANAIREKTGDTQSLLPSEMSEKIKSISTGVDAAKIANREYDFGNFMITETVLNVPIYAFNAMDSYTNPNLTEINYERTFMGSGIKSFKAPKLVTMVGIYHFAQCANLAEFECSPELTVIPSRTFSRCSSLAYVPNSENVIEIGSQCFEFGGIASVNLPKLTKLDGFAFSRCTPLTTVVLPKVTTLSAHTFNFCTALQSVDIGSDITSIHADTFANTRNKITFTIRATMPPTVSADFNLGAGGEFVEIRVPAESVEGYKTSPVWRNYTSVISAI